MKTTLSLFAAACLAACLGCQANQKPCITAVSLNNDCHFGQETGIPFYLPKPLMIVSKNFRNIEESKVGLTNTAPIPTGFDDQSKYADLNARTNFNFDGNGAAETGGTAAATNTGSAVESGQILHSPNGAPVTPFKSPSDGLGPDTFYTYHIVFVPDLTQKYGLRIRGGPGEIRAAMNLVNGWQYTGMGPYYAKDSSSAQNILSGGIAARLGGQAAQDVLKGVADLVGTKPGALQSGGQFDTTDSRIQKLSETISQLPADAQPMVIPAFAEIHVYEPSLGPDGMMIWNEIASCVFNREYLGVKRTEVEYTPQAAVTPNNTPSGQLQSGGEFGTTGADSKVAQSAIAAVFGVSADSAAIQPTAGALQSGGEFGTAGAAGGVNQVNVSCDDDCEKPTKHFSLINLKHPFHKRQERAKRQTKIVSLPPGSATIVPGVSTVTNTSSNTQPFDPALQSVGGNLQSGGEFQNQASGSGSILNNATLNQPTLNQPQLNQPTLNQPKTVPADPSGGGS